MDSYVWLVIAVFLVQVNCDEDCADIGGTIFPDPSYGPANENFLVTVSGLKAPLQSCSVNRTYDGASIVVDAQTNRSDIGVFYRNYQQEGGCGVFFQPLTRKLSGNWYFRGIDGDQKKWCKRANIGPLDPPDELKPKIVQKQVGEAIHVSCDTEHAVYAKVYNPDGELVAEGLEASIDIPLARKQDEGIWKCVVLLESSSAESSYTVEIQVSEESIFSKKTETDSQVNLLWTVIDVPRHCLFERPDGLLLNILEGVVGERYNYFGKGKSKYECGISISKPFNKEDIGIWKFLTRPFAYPDPCVGGFLEVTASTPSDGASDDIPVYTKTKSIALVQGTDLTIQCNTRASLAYCYLQSPSGKIYNAITYVTETSLYYTGLGLNVGDCQITIPAKNVNISDSGEWICGMGVKGLYEDLQVVIDVSMSASNFTVIRQEVTASNGGSVVLGCGSIKGYALDYCRFNRPDGMGINVVTGSADEYYTYFGHGLERGECNLRIIAIRDEDIGVWKCTAMFRAGKLSQEYSDTITVVEGSSFSTSIGIGVGVALGCVAVALGGVVVWRRRKAYQERRQRLMEMSRQNDERDRIAGLQELSSHFRRASNHSSSAGSNSLSFHLD